MCCCFVQCGAVKLEETDSNIRSVPADRYKESKMHKSLLTAGMALICFTGICLMTSHETLPQAQAQSKGNTPKTTKKPGNVKTLDVRALKLQADFSRESTALARDYEKAGDLEKARQVYGVLSRLNPQAKDIRERIKQIDEAILSANAFDVVVDTSIGWGVPLARVSKGKPVRIQAAGTYTFQASLQVGPTGFSVAEPTKTDLAGDVRCGALMGLVVANGKPGKPFAVGGGRNFTPRNNGLLYLRVNAPAGSKCTGRISVRLGGNVAQN